MPKKKSWLKDCLTKEFIKELEECTEKKSKAEFKVRMCPVFNEEIECDGVCECCEAEDAPMEGGKE